MTPTTLVLIAAFWLACLVLFVGFVNFDCAEVPEDVEL